MQINNVLASLPVKDLAVSRAWYERLFGRTSDSTPMPTLAEWRFGAAAVFRSMPDLTGRAGAPVL
jgi:glyoxylase I family protein